MTEIPNNAKPIEMMDFKKFSQSLKHLIYSEEKVWMEGKFKFIDGEEIISGDNFWANVVHTSGKLMNAEEIYKTYIEWFNRTLRPGETKRIFISAKIIKQKTGETK